jgi:hypothetical protein
MSADTGGSSGEAMGGGRIEEAERRLMAAAEVAAEAERRASAEIKALEDDIEREREAKERAIATAADRLGEIEAQTEAAEKRIEEAERRAEAAERAVEDEKARAREGAASWLRQQLETIRREAEGR